MTQIFDKINQIKTAGNINPNILINGNFDIWQRGSIFSNVGYTADRWFFAKDGDATVVRASNNTLDNSTNCLRIETAGSGSVNYNIYNCIETIDTIPLRNSYATISYYYRAPIINDASGLLLCYLNYSNLNNDIITYKLPIDDSYTSSEIIKDNTWRRVYKSFMIPNGASTLALEIKPLYAQNGRSIIEIAQVCLEKSSKVSNFKPTIYQQELKKCQRYYQNVDCSLRAGTDHSSSIGSRKFGISLTLPAATRTSSPKIINVSNKNNLLDNVNATIVNNNFLNIAADSKASHAELLNSFVIDDEIPIISKPKKITNININRNINYSDISIIPPYDSNSPIISYTINYGSSPNQLTGIITNKSNTIRISGFKDISSLYINSIATNAAGDSLVSDTFSSGPQVSPPSGFTNIRGEWTINTIVLSYDLPTNNGGAAVTGNKIVVSTSSSFSPEYAFDVISNGPVYREVSTIYPPPTYYGVREVSSTGSYYFKLIPINRAGSGQEVVYELAKTIASGISSIQSRVYDKSVEISYYTFHNGGSQITGINLEYSTNSNFTPPTSVIYAHPNPYNSNISYINVTGLTNNALYYFRIKAINALGTGLVSSIISATPNKPKTIPDAPINGHATWSLISTDMLSNAQNISVGCGNVVDNGGEPITNYGVVISPSSSFSTSALYTTTNAQPVITIPDIYPSSNTLYFRSRAHNILGISQTGSTFSLNRDVPDVIGDAITEVGHQSVKISWREGFYKGSLPTGHRIKVYNSSLNQLNSYIVPSSVYKLKSPIYGDVYNTYTVSGLTNKTEYAFTVESINSFGTSSISNYYRATPTGYSVPEAVRIKDAGIVKANASFSYDSGYNIPIPIINVSQFDLKQYDMYNEYYIPINTLPNSTGRIYGNNSDGYMAPPSSDINTAVLHSRISVGRGMPSSRVIVLPTGLKNIFIGTSVPTPSFLVSSGSTGVLSRSFKIDNSLPYFSGIYTNYDPPLSDGNSSITGYSWILYEGVYDYNQPRLSGIVGSGINSFSVRSPDPYLWTSITGYYTLRIRAQNNFGQGAISERLISPLVDTPSAAYIYDTNLSESVSSSGYYNLSFKVSLNGLTTGLETIYPNPIPKGIFYNIKVYRSYDGTVRAPDQLIYSSTDSITNIATGTSVPYAVSGISAAYSIKIIAYTYNNFNVRSMDSIATIKFPIKKVSSYTYHLDHNFLELGYFDHPDFLPNYFYINTYDNPGQTGPSYYPYQKYFPYGFKWVSRYPGDPNTISPTNFMSIYRDGISIGLNSFGSTDIHPLRRKSFFTNNTNESGIYTDAYHGPDPKHALVIDFGSINTQFTTMFIAPLFHISYQNLNYPLGDKYTEFNTEFKNMNYITSMTGLHISYSNNSTYYFDVTDWSTPVPIFPKPANATSSNPLGMFSNLWYYPNDADKFKYFLSVGSDSKYGYASIENTGGIVCRYLRITQSGAYDPIALGTLEFI